MVDAGRVDVLQAAQQLEEQPPRVYVVVLGLALDQVREIGVEQLRDDEDVVEGLLALGYQHLGDGHDVRVAQQPQEAQLADDAHRVRFVGEDAVDVLDGDLLAGGAVAAGDDGAVGALADAVRHLVQGLGAALALEEVGDAGGLGHRRGRTPRGCVGCAAP